MKVFLQRLNQGSAKLSKEEAAVYQHCLIHNIPIVRVELNDTPLPSSIHNADLVVGNVHFVHRCLSALGITHECIDYYPECLRPFLHREIRSLSAMELVNLIQSSKKSDVFAKPKELKLFTGKVFSFNSNIDELLNLPPDTPLLVSPVKKFLCEYRIYIINHQIVASCRYDDNPDDDLAIDMGVVSSAIDELQRNSFEPVAYCLDFGLLSNGKTALVEVTDGYALGRYRGINDSDYFKLLKLRWDQLVGTGTR
ncbi:TPA: ATP-grasp domain-containing protein [Vibrio cholerae]|nr:ATP-grasp domain-containing protein [Vibrio cholerae]